MNFWKEEEINIIHNRIGYDPIDEIVSDVQKLDKRKGWEVRSDEAVRLKIKRMGYSLRTEYDNLTIRGLADTLGAKHPTVYSWVVRNGLKCRKVSKLHSAIRLSDFKEWASCNKEKLTTYDRDSLMWLLDDKVLVEEIKSLITTKRPIALINLSTGVEYKTATQAGISCFIDPDTVARHAKKARKENRSEFECLGCRFKIAS